MPNDALDRALRSVGRKLDDPTSHTDRWSGYRALLGDVVTDHLAERAVLTEPDLGVKSAVLAVLLELRSPTRHRDLLERAGMADDAFLTGRSRDLTVAGALAHEPSSFRPEDLDGMSPWLPRYLVRLGVPEINQALAERGATKRVRQVAANHLGGDVGRRTPD
jgi:hypothetical protein